MSPSERTLRARAAAHKSWAATPDRSARTLPARQAFIRRFEDQVDPDRKLAPAERRKRAESARKAFYSELSAKAAKAKAAKRKAAGR